MNEVQQATPEQAHDLIRSRHDGAHWWDTQMTIGESVRVVRVYEGDPGGN